MLESALIEVDLKVLKACRVFMHDESYYLQPISKILKGTYAPNIPSQSTLREQHA